MIPVIDNDNVLNDIEKKELGLYIVEKCRSNLQDINWLKHIIITDDGFTDYFGYWTISIPESIPNSYYDFETAIILNSRYLRTLESMKRVLAHEYGHNWTLGYLYYLERISDHFKDKAPRLYYRIRRLDRTLFNPNYEQEWSTCDKEVLAEDYRVLFTDSQYPHKMREIIGYPSTEVASYLKKMGKRHWE